MEENDPKMLVVGRKGVGKRYFMNKVGGTIDMFEENTQLVFHQQTVFMERPKYQVDIRKYKFLEAASAFKWECLIVVVDSSDSVEQLHTARNLVCQALQGKDTKKIPVGVVYHCRQGKPAQLSFEKRNRILDLDSLPFLGRCDIDYSIDYLKSSISDINDDWKVRIHRLLLWLIEKRKS